MRHEITEWEQLQPGMKLVYYGKTTVTPNAVYDATVIKRYNCFVLLRVIVRQSSLNELKFLPPMPYNTCVNRCNLGREAHLFAI